MSYVKTINEDGAVSDIMAVALNPTLDATLLHKSELENDLTQTTSGINALDAAQGKVLNDAIGTLDGAVVKKANLVNGFTQTTAGVNALDAKAGKTLHDDFTARMTPAPNSNTDLSSYTDSASPFVCPHDGYVQVRNNDSQDGIIVIQRSDGNTSYINIGAAAGRYCLYVQKGTRVYVTGTATMFRFTAINNA